MIQTSTAPTDTSGPTEKHPLKVLLLSFEYTPAVNGGAGTQVYELANGLGAAGCEVTVLTYTAHTTTVQKEGRVTVHHIAPSVASYATAAQQSIVHGMMAFSDDLVAYARRLLATTAQRPDIINYHAWYTFSAARQLAQEFNIPIVGTIHGLAEPVNSWYGQVSDPEMVQQEQALFAEAEVLITVSQSMRAIIQATHNVPASRIHVVYNGLAPHRFRPPATRPPDLVKLRHLVAPPEAMVVLFAGRLNSHKGITELFAAAAEVVAAAPDMYYLIAGEADSRAFASSMSELLDRHPVLRSRLKLLGKVPREQLAKLYQIADLAVVPSIYEAFGYVAIEAMVAGLPVVASAVGGLAEIMTHEVTGLLVPVHQSPAGIHHVDVPALAAAQLRLARDRALARQLGLAGQQHVLATFTLDHMVKATLQVYRHTINNTCRAE